jgi:hypothetical protein
VGSPRALPWLLVSCGVSSDPCAPGTFSFCPCLSFFLSFFLLLRFCFFLSFFLSVFLSFCLSFFPSCLFFSCSTVYVFASVRAVVSRISCVLVRYPLCVLARSTDLHPGKFLRVILYHLA